MRFLRALIAVLFAVVLTLTMIFRVSVKIDATNPEITVDTDVIEAKCSVSDEELLKHVRATDAKDGDLTDKVFVENISQFIEEGQSNVTFCVSDHDNNVSKKTVKLLFTDYEKPEFYLNDDLVFPEGGIINVTGCASVTDKIDGNITPRLSVVVNDDDSGNERVPINFKVSNSMGFIYRWTIDAVKVDPYTLNSNYSINIGNHLLVLNVGDKKPDFRKMIKSVFYMGEAFTEGKITVDDRALDLSKPGTYDVWFNLYIKEETVNKKGEKVNQAVRVTRERLIVICEDQSK